MSLEENFVEESSRSKVIFFIIEESNEEFACKEVRTEQRYNFIFVDFCII